MSESALLGDISSRFRINRYTGKALEVAELSGPYIYTRSGERLIDMFMAHGTNVIGHRDQRVVAALKHALECGVIVGHETGLGERVAAKIRAAVPSVEKLRYTASGSEAVSTALRIARAFTGRDLVVRIDGQFHGGSDYALFNQLFGAIDRSNPGGRPSLLNVVSGGVPARTGSSIIPIPWNDIEALNVVLAEHGRDIAAVVLTPIDFNNGCIVPAPGYLEAVRACCDAHGVVLIFDEILSGFKTGLGCAQAEYNVRPDLTTLSKAVSCGVPLSVVGGSEEIMQVAMRAGREGAHQGGTFAGNILGLAAADATLDILAEEMFYPTLLARSAHFYEQLQDLFDANGLPASVQSAGCGFGIYLGTRDPVESCSDILKLDWPMNCEFFARCIDAGVYFQSDFTISSAHTDDVLGEVLDRVEGVIGDFAAKRRLDPSRQAGG